MVGSVRRAARLLALSVFVGLLVLVPHAATANNSRLDSVPRPNSELDVEPGRVTIAFREDLPKSGVTIVVQDSRGEDVTNGAFHQDANDIYVDLVYPLPRDTYTVNYRVADDGGVPFGGRFQFAYGDGDFDSPGEVTWRGASAIPPVVALDGDKAGSGGTARPNPTPTSDSTPGTPSDGPKTNDAPQTNGSSPDAGDEADSAADAATSGSSDPWTLVLAIILIMLLVGAGTYLLMAHRRRTQL